MSADQPLTGDELATIKTRRPAGEGLRDLDLLERVYREQAWADGRPRTDVLALVAEVRRLRAEVSS